MECFSNYYSFICQIIGTISFGLLIGYIVKTRFKNRNQCKLRYAEMFTGAQGKVTYNSPLSPYTRLRVGGPAQILFRPSDLSDLVSVIKRKPSNMPLTVLGMGSNILVRDGGVHGIVIKLEKGFMGISFDMTNCQFEVGAGFSQQKLAKLCAENGIGGLEFLCGVPGTIGGALRMNAGAYGTEIKDLLISATLVNASGNVQTCSVTELHYGYRSCGIPDGWIFVSARFQGIPKKREQIEDDMASMLKIREETQPVNARTAGCTFANVDSERQAWKLISAVGCQGLQYRGAQISDKHANFLVNNGSATARDLEDLAETVRYKVLEKYELDLKWEVKCIGVYKG